MHLTVSVISIIDSHDDCIRNKKASSEENASWNLESVPFYAVNRSYMSFIGNAYWLYCYTEYYVIVIKRENAKVSYSGLSKYRLASVINSSPGIKGFPLSYECIS